MRPTDCRASETVGLHGHWHHDGASDEMAPPSLQHWSPQSMFVHKNLVFPVFLFKSLFSTVILCAVLCYGGFARVSSALNAVRATGPTLFFDGGDQFTGTLFSALYQGAESYPFQNYLQTSAMVSSRPPSEGHWL